MVRCVLILFAALWCVPTMAEAGWLTDKLKEAAKDIGGKAIDEGSHGTYEGAKKGAKQAVTTDDRPEGQPEPSTRQQETPEELGTGEDEKEDAGEFLRSQPQFQETRGSSFRNARNPQRPPRTDLHFSADTIMVDRDTSRKESRGKMYVDGERMRMEMTDPEQGKPVITIMDGQSQKFLLLMPSEKTFMEMPMSSAEGDEDWRSALSAEPCDGYRMAEEMGPTTHAGRSVVQWSCEDPEDPEDAFNLFLWFDAKLHMPVRSEDSEGNRFELRNLKEDAQSSSLFSVPGEYTRMNLFGGGSAGRESSNPYAPKVEPVPGSEGSLGAMFLTNTVAPDASAVGIPCYPGARVFQAMDKPVIAGGTNHVLVLFSKDAPERVLAFYRMKLSGWTEEKLMGVGDPVFHRGAGSIDLFSAEGQSTPNVTVETITESMKFEVMPTARTKITLGYQPRS